MSVYRAPNSDYFYPSATPNFAFNSRPGPEIPPGQPFDTTTLTIWAHFHTMPLDGNKDTWDLFFDDQYSLESRLLAPPPKRFFLAPLKQERRMPQSPEEDRFYCPLKDCPFKQTFLKKDIIRHFIRHHPYQGHVLRHFLSIISLNKKEN